MAGIVSLGSINADFVVRTDAAPSGSGSVVARRLLRTSGGKAANVAVLAARLGADASLLGCVGDDDLAEQALAGPIAEGVDITGVRRRDGPTGYSSVIVPADGRKLIVFVPGANDAWADQAEEVAECVAAAPDGSVVVADVEVPPVLVERAMEAARRHGLTTVLDPAPTDRVVDRLLALCDHVTPDEAEAEQLTGIECRTESGAARAGEQLRERGAGTVHVKLAGGGCVTVSERGARLVPAPSSVDVVDTTGAGDAFTGALAHALLRTEDVPTAAQIAVAASTCAVTGYGSQESYPSATDLKGMVGRLPPVRWIDP